MPNPMTHDEKLRQILERVVNEYRLKWTTPGPVFTQAIADINALWGEPVGIPMAVMTVHVPKSEAPSVRMAETVPTEECVSLMEPGQYILYRHPPGEREVVAWEIESDPGSTPTVTRDSMVREYWEGVSEATVRPLTYAPEKEDE